jgi:MT-A70
MAHRPPTSTNSSRAWKAGAIAAVSSSSSAFRTGNTKKMRPLPTPRDPIQATPVLKNPSEDLLAFADGRKFKTILADPPWRFTNRTGKMAPEHRRLSRYDTMSLEEIQALPVSSLAGTTAHLYLWVPNALLPEGLAVMQAWGFQYKSNVIWHKIRKDSNVQVAPLQHRQEFGSYHVE